MGEEAKVSVYMLSSQQKGIPCLEVYNNAHMQSAVAAVVMKYWVTISNGGGWWNNEGGRLRWGGAEVLE